jgi:CopG family nickel-responsive transcriptional regulator
VAIVSVSLPDELLSSADKVIEKRGFTGRSDLVRASLREFLAANPAPRPGARSATLTLCYPEGHERKFSDLRHEHGGIVRTMIHAHAADHSCVEVYVLEGPGERILSFADALRGRRDALQVSLTFADAWKER